MAHPDVHQIDGPVEGLQLPSALVDLIDRGVWASLTGFGCMPNAHAFYDSVLNEVCPGGTEFATKGPPFRTYADHTKPTDPNTPEQRLLTAAFGDNIAESDASRLEHLRVDCGVALLEPGLAVMIAESDSWEYPDLILDYRDDPPSVRRLVFRTIDTPADWPLVADTFEGFAAQVGLQENGPLYWSPCEQPTTPAGGVTLLAHEHPFGARLSVERYDPSLATISCWLHDELFHVRQVRRRHDRDLTGQMKRAMVEILTAEDPAKLSGEFADRFPDDQPGDI